MSNQSRAATAGGFTLIEIMISVTLLAIGLLAVGSGQITILTQGKRSSDTMKAAAAAENIIELMRRNGNNIAAYQGMSTTSTSTATLTQRDLDFIDWKNQLVGAASPIRVTGATGAVALGVQTTGAQPVTVTIAWPGRPNGIAFTTTIACKRTVCP